MNIKVYTVKTNGQLKKTPVMADSLNTVRHHILNYYQVTSLDYISHVDVGKQTYYELEGAIIHFDDLIKMLKDDVVRQNEEYNNKIKQQQEDHLKYLQQKVSETCNEEEAKFFWMLYGNLTAEFNKAYWDDEEDTISLFFKGIPLERFKP